VDFATAIKVFDTFSGEAWEVAYSDGNRWLIKWQTFLVIRTAGQARQWHPVLPLTRIGTIRAAAG